MTPAREEVFSSTREAAQRDELYAIVPAWREVWPRRSWAALVPRVVRAEPADSALYVDGKLAASGDLTRPLPAHREPTRSALSAPATARSRGASCWSRRKNAVHRAAEGVRGRDLHLLDPPGADLYVDSLWKGRTPLMVERPTQRSRGVLSRQVL